MSMQLRIVHTTTLRVRRPGGRVVQPGPDDAADHARPDRRAQPARGRRPTPWTYDYRDYFGTEVTAFEVLDPHESMTVTATSTVHTDRRPRRHADARPGTSSPTREVADRWTEYLALPDLVAPAGRARRAARELAARRRDLPGDAARDVCALVARRGRVRRRRHRRAHRGRRRLGAARRRLPGHGAPGRSAALRIDRHPGPLRLRLPPPARRARDRRDRRAASRTPGSSGGTTAGTPSTRPTTSSPATATSWSPPAATTSTYARCTASTPAPRRPRCSSRWSHAARLTRRHRVA